MENHLGVQADLIRTHYTEHQKLQRQLNLATSQLAQELEALRDDVIEQLKRFVHYARSVPLPPVTTEIPPGHNLANGVWFVTPDLSKNRTTGYLVSSVRTLHEVRCRAGDAHEQEIVATHVATIDVPTGPLGSLVGDEIDAIIHAAHAVREYLHSLEPR